MTGEQLRLVTGFASALGKLKAKQEQGLGCDLSPDEVAGIIWGVRNLRGAPRTDHERVGKP